MPTNRYRLRTLSSQGSGGSSGPLSPSKPHQTSMTPTTTLAKKFKLAEFRYGKEELLQLFVDSPELPRDMPVLVPIINGQPSPPLAFLPLSEEEQVSKNRVDIKRAVTHEMRREHTASITSKILDHNNPDY